MAVMKIYREEHVIEHLQFQGERLRRGMLQSIRENNLIGNVGIHGHPSCLVFSTQDQDRKPSQAFRTLFMQECIKQGLIAPNLVISLSHSDKDIDQTIDIIHHALKVYRKGLDEGVDKYLEGRSVQPVYRKWNNEHRNKT
ncbi:MAG: glutamate-1-semialdehyde 2,1-aminomutase [Saprospiraceae bacterium]